MIKSDDSLAIQYTDGKRINLVKLKHEIDRNMLKINLITDKMFGKNKQNQTGDRFVLKKSKTQGNELCLKDRFKEEGLFEFGEKQI